MADNTPNRTGNGWIIESDMFSSGGSSAAYTYGTGTVKYICTPSTWSIGNLANLPSVQVKINYLGALDTDDFATFEYEIYYDGNPNGDYFTAETNYHKSRTKKVRAMISVLSSDSDVGYLRQGELFTVTEDRVENGFHQESFSRLPFKSGWHKIVEPTTFTVKRTKDPRTVNFTFYVDFQFDSNGDEKVYAYKVLSATETSEKTYAQKSYKITCNNFSIPALATDHPANKEDTEPTDAPPGTADPTTEARAFTVDWSTDKEFNIDDETATSAPGKPILSIDGTELTISLDKGKNLESEHNLMVVFEVVKDDKERIFSADNVANRVYDYTRNTLTNIVEVTCNVEIGHKYKARCRSIKEVKGREYTSEWSEWSDSVSAAPVRPEGLTCRALSSDGVTADSIYLSWSPCTTAKTYTVRYITPDPDTELTVEQMFELGPYTEKGTEEGVSECILGPIDTGKTYYIGVCAIGESEERSDWSNLVSVVLGSVPAAPTTWSSRSVISSGESVTLYWTHNSTDGSPEVFAKPIIYVNDTLYPTEYVYRTTRFKTDMEVYAGRYYTNGVDKFFCIQNGYPKSIDDTSYFAKVDGGYSESEASFYVLNTGMKVVKGCYYVSSSDTSLIYECTKTGAPESLSDEAYFSAINHTPFIAEIPCFTGNYYTARDTYNLAPVSIYKCIKILRPSSLSEKEYFDKIATEPYQDGAEYTKGAYYTNGAKLYLCIESCRNEDLDRSEYFTEVQVTMFVPDDHVVKGTYYYTDRDGVYVCIKSTDPSVSLDDPAYFKQYDVGVFKEGNSWFGDGAKIKWSIQTAGISNKLGPSSTTREITVYAPPTMDLSVTDHTGAIFDTLTSLPIHVYALTGPATQRPIGYHMTVEVSTNGQGSYVIADSVGNEQTVHEGEVIYSKYFDTNEPLDTTLSAGDISLANNVKYTLTVTASMDSGLSVKGSTDFTVSWAKEQYLPMATILVNKNIFATAVCPYCEETVTKWHRATKHVTTCVVNGEEKEYIAYSANSEYAPESIDVAPLIRSARSLGKNRLDMNTVIDAHNCTTFIDSKGLNIIKEDDISYATLMPMYLAENTKYVLSFKTTSTTSGFIWVDEDDEPVTGFNIKTFTPSKTGYYSIRFYNDRDVGSVVTISNAQVEKGTKSTGYEEYKGAEILQEYTVDGQPVYYTDCTGVYICTSSGSAESIDERNFFTRVVAEEWFPGQVVSYGEHFTYEGDTYRCISSGSPNSIEDGVYFTKVSDQLSDPGIFDASMQVVKDSYYINGSNLYHCLESGTVKSIIDSGLKLIQPTVWITGMVSIKDQYYTDGVDTYLCESEADPETLSGDEHFTKIVPERFTTTMSVSKDQYYTYGSAAVNNYYCPVKETALTKDVLLSVYRRNYDGTYTEISKNKENTRIYAPDPHPPLDYARYRIVAMSKATGAVSYNDLPSQKIGCKSVIIQWNEDWNDYHSNKGPTAMKTWSGSMLNLPYNIDVSDKRSTEVEMVKYVGRKHPVSYYGTQLGETATWSCVIPKTDTDTLYALRRLSAWAGDVYVREPSGVGYWANITVNFSLKHNQLTVPVTFDITRVEGGT